MKNYRYYLVDDAAIGTKLIQVPKRIDKKIVQHAMQCCFSHCNAEIESLKLIDHNTYAAAGGFNRDSILANFEDCFVPTYFLHDHHQRDLKKIGFNDIDTNLLSVCNEKFMRQLLNLWKNRKDPTFRDCMKPSHERLVLSHLKTNYKELLKQAYIKDIIK